MSSPRCASASAPCACAWPTACSSAIPRRGFAAIKAPEGDVLLHRPGAGGGRWPCANGTRSTPWRPAGSASRRSNTHNIERVAGRDRRRGGGSEHAQARLPVQSLDRPGLRRHDRRATRYRPGDRRSPADPRRRSGRCWPARTSTRSPRPGTSCPGPGTVTDALLARCPHLLAVSSGGAGFDTVDAAACTRAGVAVLNQVGGNARSVAGAGDRPDARGLTEDLRLGSQAPDGAGLQPRVADGSRDRRRDAGYRRDRTARGATWPSSPAALRHARPRLRPAALRRRDPRPRLPRLWTGRGCSRSPTSSRCIARWTTRRGAASMRTPSAAMKPGARVRHHPPPSAGVHDEAALADALTSGHLAGRGPRRMGSGTPASTRTRCSPLDKVVATYHTAGVTHEARRKVAAWGAEQVIGPAQRAKTAADRQPRGVAAGPGAARGGCSAEPEGPRNSIGEMPSTGRGPSRSSVCGGSAGRPLPRARTVRGRRNASLRRNANQTRRAVPTFARTGLHRTAAAGEERGQGAEDQGERAP